MTENRRQPSDITGDRLYRILLSVFSLLSSDHVFLALPLAETDGGTKTGDALNDCWAPAFFFFFLSPL